MTKSEAVKKVVEISETYENSYIWDEFGDDELFQMGMEYGIVIALTQAFNITKEDIGKKAGADEEAN